MNEVKLVKRKLIAQRCRVCHCTDDDCTRCIQKTGTPCHWVKLNLCSACEGEIKDDNTLANAA